MSSNHEDTTAREMNEARLTAYALDQLPPAEREAAEAVLARSAEARQSVEETAALAACVREAYEQAPALEASVSLREAIERQLQLMTDAGEEVTASLLPRQKRSWIQRHLVALAMTGTCVCLLIGLLLPASQSARQCTQIMRQSDSLPSLASRSGPGSGLELAGREYPKPFGQPSPRELPVAFGREAGEESSRSPYYLKDDVQYNSPPTAASYSSSDAFASPRERTLEEGFVPSPNTEQYNQISENRFRSVIQQPLSTFSIDVDTASYANVRRFLNDGQLPPPDAVRIEEMINYFNYDYAPPSDNTPFAVHLETAECPWQPAHRLVRIGLKGREVERNERGASNFVFLLDVSGSMAEPNKLPLVKQAMRMLVEQLNEDDRVAIVTYASGTDVRLPSARGNERKRIIAAVDALQADGCTYGSAGINLAYKQAEAHFIPGGVNRVILCTDGDLNVGLTNDDDLVRLIEQKAKSGVFLTVLGFGTGNLKDGKLEKLADKGNGMYAYVDSLREAHRVLVEKMTGTLVTIAKDVKIQVEFNPAEVTDYRLIGYEKRVMANRDFDNDRKDAGEIGAGHTVTALYEVVPAHDGGPTTSAERPLKYQRVPDKRLTHQARTGELLTLRLRYKEPEQNESRLLEFAAKDSGVRFDQASTEFRFAASVAAFGMVLRDSSGRGSATLAAVEEYAAGTVGKDVNGHRAEFLDLVRRAKSLSPRK